MDSREQAALDALAESGARATADSIDAAADDLVRNGPVAPDELRRMLTDIETEWASATAETPPIRTPRA